MFLIIYKFESYKNKKNTYKKIVRFRLLFNFSFKFMGIIKIFKNLKY